MRHQTHEQSHAFQIGLIAILTWLLCAGIALAGQPATQPVAESISRIGTTVGDLDRSVAWYRDVLGFTKLDETELAGSELETLTGVFGAKCRVARLKLGDEELELTEFLAPRGRNIRRDSRSNDRWFQHVAIIVSDIDRAYATLRRHKVRHVSPGPQTLPEWNPNAGGIRAFYFNDPDGHVLEILQFPAGKGDPKWHAMAKSRPADQTPFLGIDHTAIVVGDTERSLRFYEQTLGMKVVGASENHGIEQERLNSVFGARLRITTLSAAAGPKVELLEYLSPRGGRRYPADSRPNDLWHWHTSIQTRRINEADRLLRSSGSAVLSAPVNGAFISRDPDGHAVKLVESQRRQ